MHLLGGRNKPGSPSKRIIIGVKPMVYDSLKSYVAEKGHFMQYAAEHLIRLGIAAEQELDKLDLLKEAPNDTIPAKVI